ncbi:hypothetical protein PPERSA_08523 [Pseudocohnilembus persalinus]|uniref:Natural resistance-associated macrophage protein n=1 Tax=Pseudocohnilembus persalinus TaxID=266149 RepID=A0A0V0R7H9_PSEPJ|nr:hypothetical protein PPERSA_08523 [Pseudocohnilembus persalinus]|eukprot:KRX10120.1 hypothetical protein PPERSA_08523 [Pseudocohnilembus persalinus]
MTYGTFVPTVPKESFVPLVGLVGSILMPHNLYLHSSLMNEPEKQVDKSDEKNFKQLLKFRKIETGLSLLLSFFINLCVISTFAYYSKKGIELDLLTAGEALESSFGDFSKLIWGIGLLASGQSSTLTSTLSGQYIIEGYIDFKMSKFKRAVLTRLVAIIPSLIIAFLHDVSTFNNYLNVLQAIQLPFAIIPLLKLCYDEDIMGYMSFQNMVTWCGKTSTNHLI